MRKTCEICGCDFSPPKSLYRFCSIACANRRMLVLRSPEEARLVERERWQQKNRRRRAQLRGAESEPYKLDEIAVRDGYRCGLCGKRVAMGRRCPDLKAPTIDHIVPLADGGSDLRANVQLAHFGCNSAKCARGGGEQLALVG